jgi:hypothetical protein
MNTSHFRNAILRLTYFSTIAICLALSATPAAAQSVVFDNLGLADGVDGDWINGDTRDMLAQQFELQNDTRITRVQVRLWGDGIPSGPVNLELWDDNGTGVPGSRIAQIANLSGRFPFPPSTLSFDTNISGLTIAQPYYVVLSFVDAVVDPIADFIGWDIAAPSSGTNGAAKALAIGDFFNGQPVPRMWRPVNDFVVGTPAEGQLNYFVMRVETAPIPEPATVGLLAMAGIMLLALRRSDYVVREK